jgi:hypothetical protein
MLLSCFPPFSIVYFYMFTRVPCKLGFEFWGQGCHCDPWKTVSVMPSSQSFLQNIFLSLLW